LAKQLLMKRAHWSIQPFGILSSNYIVSFYTQVLRN